MASILIVDASPTVRAELSEALDAAGFRTLPCATIAEARAALRTQQITLAILDVRLPDGDGIELLEKIRHEPGLMSLPVLMLSSEAQIKDRIRGLRNGANDYVGKPYDSAQVVARVRQLIGGPPVRDLVLVIDDDAAYRTRVSEALLFAGFAVATAPGGAAGLQLAASARPTAILVAAVMPDVDGASVIRRLRLDPGLRTTPCLLLTGAEAKEAELRALDAGADGFVRKDDLDVVIARIRALLRSSSSVRVDAASMLAPKRILAVDDDPDFLGILGDRLRKRGYDVVRATSGEEALELLDVQTVDCILLDRSMAGIGGIETCRRLKASPSLRGTPLIILTAMDQRDAVIEGLGAGADDFVSKGAGFEVLSARVQAQIRRKQVEDEQREAAEARAAREVAESRASLAEELQRSNRELSQTNRELESFSYTVSHDLRAPLRTISAFTHALVEELGDQLDERQACHIRRVLAASSRMAQQIDALLELSRISRAPIARYPVDLSALAVGMLDELARHAPERRLTVVVEPDLIVDADGRLLRIALDYLIEHAWKGTAGVNAAKIEVGVDLTGSERVFYVRDNADRALVGSPEGAAFCGTPFATVRRIVERHGGRVWVAGRQVSFTLGAALT